MRTFLAFVWLCAACQLGCAQDAPRLAFAIPAAGEMTLRWPVQRLHSRVPLLVPTYDIETASQLGQWKTAFAGLRGTNFPGGTAEVRLLELGDVPATFVRIRAHLDFKHYNFIRSVMTNATLRNATFAGADLLSANLLQSDLRGADFSGADLREARLEAVNARDADFTLARLAQANCKGSQFSGASFLFAELSDADFSNSILENADLRGAVMEGTKHDYTRFHGAQADALTAMTPRTRANWEIVNQRGAGRNYAGVNLSFTDLEGGDLSNAILNNVDFSAADMRNANLSGANLNAANMRFVDFSGVVMDDATVIMITWRTIWDIINHPRVGRAHPGANLSQGFWVRPVLERADLRGALFNSGQIVEGNFIAAIASNASFGGVQFLGADFRNADLRFADFRFALLENVNFRGANITAAIFDGATFRNTTMPDGTVRN